MSHDQHKQTGLIPRKMGPFGVQIGRTKLDNAVSVGSLVVRCPNSSPIVNSLLTASMDNGPMWRFSDMMRSIQSHRHDLADTTWVFMESLPYALNFENNGHALHHPHYFSIFTFLEAC